MASMDIDKKKSYINFKIGTESFAVSVFKVLEIIRMEQITRVPNASDFVPGIINFRGSIVPVIELHKRFNMESMKSDNQMVVVVDIVCKDKNVLMGLLVDEVTDVIEFEYKSIKAVPDLGIKYNPEFVEGFIEKDNKFIIVLNIDRVLNVDELAQLDEIIHE